MFETSKALMRRLHDSRFATRYFVGNGIDIGAGADVLGQYAEFFPLMNDCRHCLEHMRDPREALKNWLRVVRPGGHLVVLVPDEDLYEQGVFPSTFNPDHKWTFTLHKAKSWSAKSINVLALLGEFADRAQTVKVESLDATYRYSIERMDQTLTPIGEAAIEFILRRLPPIELKRGGRYADASRAKG